MVFALALFAGSFVSPIGTMLMLSFPVGVIAIRHPFVALIGFLFLSSLDDMVVLSQNLTFTKVVGVGLVASYLLQKSLSNHRISSILPNSLKLIIVWNVWGALSLGWSIAPNATIGRLTTQLMMLALVFLIVNIIDTPSKARRALVVFATSGLFISVVGIIAFQTNVDVQELGRASASTKQSVTNFASIAASCTAVYIGLAFYGHHQTRIVYLLGIAISVMAILSAAGRGALTSLLAVIVVLLLSKRDSLSGFLFFCLLLPTLGIVIWIGSNNLGLISEKALYRLHIDTILDSGAAGRLEIYESFLYYIFPEKPMTGFGLGTAPIAHEQNPQALLHSGFPTGRDTHNALLFILIDLGLIGLGLWLAFHAILLKDVWQVAVEVKRQGLLDIYWAAVFLFVQVFFNSLSSTYIWEKRYWIALGFIMLVVRLAHTPMDSWVKSSSQTNASDRNL